MVSCDEKLERGTKGEMDEGNHCHLHHKILLQIITKTVTITIMNYKVMRSQETGGKWSRVMRKRQAELVSRVQRVPCTRIELGFFCPTRT